MEKTILVTGKDTFLGNEISLFFLRQGHKTAVSTSPRQEGFPDVEQDRKALLFSWNKRSAISAKNFLLQTHHDLGPLDEAWVIFTADREGADFPGMTTAQVEELMDHSVKGFLFLVRELLALQTSRPELRIHFVLFDEDKEGLSPLESLQYHGVRAFVSALLLQAKKKNLPVWAFENINGSPEAFVEFVLNIPRESGGKNPTSGKWHLLNTKKNIFNQFFQAKE